MYLYYVVCVALLSLSFAEQLTIIKWSLIA